MMKKNVYYFNTVDAGGNGEPTIAARSGNVCGDGEAQLNDKLDLLDGKMSSLSEKLLIVLPTIKAGTAQATTGLDEAKFSTSKLPSRTSGACK